MVHFDRCFAAALMLCMTASCLAAALERDVSSSFSPDLTQSSDGCMLNWLRSLRIATPAAINYTLLFARERVDEAILKQLSLDELLSLGVSKFGHRIAIHNSLSEGNGTPPPCKNGGSCDYSETESVFGCICREGFSGEQCDEVTDECSAFPCRNGGTCVRAGSAGSCSCPAGFTGDKCEKDHCSDQPCQHGGTCLSSATGYNCSCPVGYDGRNCERAVISTSDFNHLKDEFSRLSSQVNATKVSMENTFVSVLDTVLTSQGPRYFKEWKTLEQFGIAQVQFFMLQRGRQFIGALISNSRQMHSGLAIFEVIEDSLTHFQTIQGDTMSSFKYFTVGGSDYIAVANSFDRELNSMKSKLYRWTGPGFVLQQQFSTKGAMDVDFHTIRNVGSFLAFSCNHNGSSYSTPSLVYAWDTVTHLFVPYQNLPTTGAQKLHFFSWNDHTYLTVANEYSASGDGRTNSTLFHWNGTRFIIASLIPTQQARDLYPFAIGCEAFLVAANFFNGDTHNTLSKVYRMSDVSGGLVEHATLNTRGVVAVEAFTVRSEHFLAVANSHDDDSGSFNTMSVIYKIDGPNFVRFQEIPTKKASSLHVFTTGEGCSAIAVANRAGKAKLYKWTSISLKKNSCCF